MSQPAPNNQEQPASPAPKPASAPAPRAPAAPATKAAGLPATAAQLRRARTRKLAIRFGLFSGLPTLVALVYFALVASPQYDATAVLAVESSRGRDDAPDAKAAGNPRDARLLVEYLRSRAALDALAEGHGFRAHYSDASHDWYARLDGDADQAELLDYYRDKVTTSRAHDSNIISLRVRAFSGERAHALATALVALAEAWLGDLSSRSRAELVRPAEAAVAAAREHLAAARHGTDAIQMEIAQEELEAAMQGLQAAQLQAARDQRYIVVVAPPSTPDAASRPRVAWDVATVLVTSLVLTAVLSLLGAAVREHANF